ncbi:MAG: hypothetical protein NZ555_06930 [Geminicoccaceae bacterium]|nr:hypothetical protein [Geminicoccaceae bacterium]MCX8100964.1 hypothetical protein [Geminicoccaceae bacterium]MDW8371208.1 hypothetical protein [Geminicoccaceae bacterium]
MREAPGRRFTAREIAEVLIRRYPEWAEKKRHASKDIFTENDLVAYLRGEINSGRNLLVKKYPSVHTIKDRPRQYYWSEPPTSVSPLTPSGREKKAEGARSLREADLYPLLGRYLHRELELWPK